MNERDLEIGRRLLAAASSGPWLIRPRDCTTFRRITGNDDWGTPTDQRAAMEVAVEDDPDVFLGWELEGPADVGRGDFNGPDCALIAWLRNHAAELLSGSAT